MNALDELESPLRLRHQQREIWVERVGWAAMLLLVVAALLGLLGPGLLSSKQAVNVDGSLEIEYHAVEHYKAPGRILIRARRSAGDQLRLSLSRSFTDHTTAESIVPRPSTVEARENDVVYTFDVSPAAPAVVMYRFKYDDFGVFDHRIAADQSGDVIAFRQCVLP